MSEPEFKKYSGGRLGERRRGTANRKYLWQIVVQVDDEMRSRLLSLGELIEATSMVDGRVSTSSIVREALKLGIPALESSIKRGKS